MKEYSRCLRCGRKLKSEKCRKLGYGETCYKKILMAYSGRHLVPKNNK